MMSEINPRLHSKTKLSWRTKIFYSFGHVLNDLCASMWFTYLLVYLHKIVGFSNVNSGALLLIGQLADAISTPLVGIESDKTTANSYGRRKVWHLVGVVSLLLSFPFIFNMCLGCGKASEGAKFVYYTPFVVVFQFGWAAIQISHLAMIPELTDNDNERITLNALRYSATVVSNILVFLVTWMLLDSQMPEADSQKLNTADSTAFTYIVVIVMSVGLFFTVLFHVGIKEQQRDCTYEFATRSSKRSASNWTVWFKEPKFYKVGTLYMCVRLVVNITQVYIPMYTIETLKLNKEAIATMPLVVYVSGFASTFTSRIMNGYIGRKITFLVGLLMILITREFKQEAEDDDGNLEKTIKLIAEDKRRTVWMWFLPSHSNQIYGASVTLGVGGSTLLVTVMTMLADMIGENVETGAFVYGAMSFLDKVSNGIAVQLIQIFYPRSMDQTKAGRMSVHPGELYYRQVMVIVTGGTTLVAFLCLLSLARWKTGQPRASDERNNGDTSRKRLLDGSRSFDNSMSWSLLCVQSPHISYEPAGFSHYGTVDPSATSSRTRRPTDESVL